MANNTWLNITVKLTDKPNSFFAAKIFENPTSAGTASTGTAVGGGSNRTLRRFTMAAWKVLTGISSGVYHGNVWITAFSDSGNKPTGNVACVQANAAGDTVVFTFGTVAITLTEGATGANGFSAGASNTTCALSLATTINAHPVLSKLMVATPSVGNCALACKLPTALLHALIMSTSDGTAFSFTQLNGGTPGVASIFPQHLPANKLP